MEESREHSRPSKEVQEKKDNSSFENPGTLQTFTPPPDGISPIPIQQKNILQLMQDQAEEEKPEYFKPNFIQQMQDLPEEERPEILQPSLVQRLTSDKQEPEKFTPESSNNMPDDVQTKMESAFNTDFSQVNIHEGSNASNIGALAYTQGNDIHFAPGKFQPHSQQGQELLGHELAHVIQQRNGKVEPTTQMKGININDSPELEQEADEMGKMAAAHVPAIDMPDESKPEENPSGSFSTGPVQMYADKDGNILPDPVTVTWGTDKFLISFYKIKKDMDQFECVVKYLGPYPADGPGVKEKTTSFTTYIGSAPLNAAIVAQTDSYLIIDLYGDGTKRVKLQDTFSLDTRFNKRRREHDLTLLVNGKFSHSGSLWVEDPKAKELKQPEKEEIPGENPGFYYTADYNGTESLIDGDGDQFKELKVLLLTKSVHEGLEMKDAPKELLVRLTQRSSGTALDYTFTLPKPTIMGSLFPIVNQVTDGKAPTEVSLILPSDSQKMLIHPGKEVGDKLKYTVVIGGKPVNYTFPKEKKPLHDNFKEGKVSLVGNTLSWDMEIGAFKDTFRVSITPKSTDKAILGISPLYRGSSLGTQGIEINIQNKLVGQILKSSPIECAIDTDGDGKADLFLYDSITTPKDYDGGGPTESNRNHHIRISGTPVGTDKVLYFPIRDNFPMYAQGSSEASKLAESNVKAVSTLTEQRNSGGFYEQLDAYERMFFAIRKKAADEGVISKSTFEKWVELSQAMIMLRPQTKGKVDAPLQAKAESLALEFYKLLSTDTKGKSKPMGASIGSSTSHNPYTQETSTVAAFYSDSFGPGLDLPKNLKAGSWSAAFQNYQKLTRGFDQWVTDNLSQKKGSNDKTATNAALISKRLGHLDAIQQHNPKRIYAAYHPDQKMKSEQDFVSEVPLELYYWKEGSKWHLKDITNPDKTWEYTADVSSGENYPPLSLLYQLNDPDHFPEGLIHYDVPGLRGGYFKTTNHMTWKKFLSYLGLGLAGVGLALSTFGTGTVAVAGLWALAASGVASGISAGIDLADHIKRGNLDGTTAVLNIAQIVGSFASTGALAAGRIAVVGSASKWTGAAAKFTLLADRVYVPLAATAGGADVLTLAVFSVDTAKKLDDIEKGGGTREDRDRAKRLLLSQLAVMGGLTALSLKGTIPDLKRGRTVILDMGPDGIPVASDGRVWFMEHPNVKAAIADPNNPKMKSTFDSNPELIYKLMADPDLRQVMVVVPKTVENLAKSPEAVKLLDEIMAEVNSLGAKAIVKAGKNTPSATKLTPEQRLLGETMMSKYKGIAQQPGFKGAVGNKADVEPYLEQLYKEAKDADIELGKVAHSIASITNGKVIFRPGPKDIARSRQKVYGPYKGDPTKLLDLSGCKIVYNSIEDLYKGLFQVETLLGGKIIRMKDRFINPMESGYRDILISLKMSNGHVSEFRLHLAAVDEFADIEHKIYEINRFYTDNEEVGIKLTEREKAIQITIVNKIQKIYKNQLDKKPDIKNGH